MVSTTIKTTNRQYLLRAKIFLRRIQLIFVNSETTIKLLYTQIFLNPGMLTGILVQQSSYFSKLALFQKIILQN